MRYTRLLGALMLAAAVAAAGDAQAPATAADLFRSTEVWTVSLTFTPDQWSALEPEGSGPRPGGPGRFQPGDLLAPAFLRGDENRDGRLSRSEFQSVGETWFRTWSRGTADPVPMDRVRSTAAELLPLPQGGPPGGRGPGLLGPEGGRNGMSAAAGIDFQYVHAGLEFQGRQFSDVAVRYKGNATYMMARDSVKKSFKIDLNKFVKGQKLAGQTTLNLHNNITDASWMNEPLSYQLFRDAGVPSPRTAYARVYITVPGKYVKQYFGLYSIVENIDEKFAEDRFGSEDGAIYKPVTRELFSYIGDEWSAYNQIYDPKTKLTKAQKRRVIDFARLVSNASDEEFRARAGEYLNLDEFARFLVVTVWLSNQDSILGMGQNFYVYLNADTNRFEFLPWDLDHSFGQFGMAGGQPEQLDIRRPWQGHNTFLERVFSVPEFSKSYQTKLADLNGTIFDAKRIARLVDTTAAAIRPAVAEESSSLLARFDDTVAGKAAERRGMEPVRGGKPIKSFAAARVQSVADQLAGRARPTDPARRPPGGFDPMAGLWSALDADKDTRISREEVAAGFGRWFDAWNADGDDHLSDKELREGLGRLIPRPPMPRGPAPF